ncbi:CRTAC1 family protein [Fluviispira multicolorata]|uniref:ASPIC/UnbV domain-containing protein n=1 Tax=Fluviispira multicolorata TaxID=2654512 RepID=A0A833N3S1_9BACT|nr:CRTAC1 family protein [Fluviispira multicolorata]KAB8029137.1 hypothetical protein GCL57_11400 [Fluviispira multicolorata]
MFFKVKKNKIAFRDASFTLDNNLPSQSYGVAIFDIDGDHENEILIANAFSENIIYKYNEEKQKFYNVAPDNFKKSDKATLSLCIGDFLGNGSQAVYMLHADTLEGIKTQYDSVFVRESNRKNILTFKEYLGTNSPMSNPYSGRSVAAVDAEGQGKHDFYVVNYDAPSLFYTYDNHEKSIKEKSKELGIRQYAGGRSILAQYIISKKAIDIFVGNEEDPNALFKKDKTGKYEEVASGYNLTDIRNNARGVAIADFDGNGFADIVVGTWEGLNSIFMQKKPGIFENLSPGFFCEPRRIRSVIVADFDNDGNEEIFINNIGQRNRMFRYLGNNDWEEIDIGPLACKGLQGTGASVGDLTGNGFLDIFISVGEGHLQKNKLFLGIQNDNSWLRIQPLTQNGFPALSAKVRLISKKNKNQTKFICSGSGYLCQMEPVAHFGFGLDNPEISYIEITWPGNGKETPPKRKLLGKDINLNTFIQVPHPNS